MLASAQSYQYNIQNYTNSSSISVIDDFTITYDAFNEKLQLDVTYANSSPEGFWLVVSDGENPKYNVSEYAIIYFDATAAQPVITAYEYDGANNANSFQTTTFLDSSSNPGSKVSGSISQSSSGGDVFSLTVHASDINAANLGPDWDGIEFGEKLGLWYHTVTFSEDPAYQDDGGLSNFSIDQNNYLDRANLKTELVPEPSSSTLLGLCGTLMLLRRKR